MYLPILIALLALVPPDGGPGSEGQWRAVEPDRGGVFEHPPMRAIGLMATKPEDVVEKVEYRGKRQRYGQIRFGSPSSTRVTVVVDEVGPGAVDLYVDADRNRKIDARDKVEGQGRTWRVPVSAQFVEAETNRDEEHTIAFRLGATGRILSAAVVGYREGAVEIGGKTCPARRTDADMDGSYASADDRIWIDLDGDGSFDPVSEQFLYRPVLTVGADRHVVRGDLFGNRLALEPLEGTGTVALELKRPGLEERVSEINVLLVGRDGSAVGIKGLEDETNVPVGEYRLSALSVSLTDPDGGPAWHFVFSEPYDHKVNIWHKVGKNQKLAIDPIGTLALSAEINDPPEDRKAGEAVTVQPRLYTGDGLLINAGYRGSPTAPGADHQTTSTVMLASPDGRTIDSVHSGFS